MKLLLLVCMLNLPLFSMDLGPISPHDAVREVFQGLRVHLISMQGSPEVTSNYIKDFLRIRREQSSKFTRDFYQDLLPLEVPSLSGAAQTQQQIWYMLIEHKIKTDRGVSALEIQLMANANTNCEIIENFLKQIKDLAR